MAGADLYLPQWGTGRWPRRYRSDAHLPAKYAYALNSLGEMICLGCGEHFVPDPGSRAPRSYCGVTCRKRVHLRGGRHTRAGVRAIIAAMGPL